ncbi:MAG TPA: twin-arginine translocase TatA/TatE family subunit [Syntrophobacteraceae bacterium]|nr:twin-arginine translocase TatA/TatE family subunit [Syntrophobacteraceae bacterium]HYA42110.1 twin-arginine translocase TatA/TatE family subunit [Syntrophobacteraceae bacterium]
MLNMTEMLLLLLGVVILVGGKKLPELGSGLGKGISEFKKAVGADKPEEEQKQIKDGETKSGDAKPTDPK